MNNRIERFGPVALTNTLTTNILNSNITSLSGPVGWTATQPVIIVRHMRVTNKTGTPQSVSLWIGATGANAAGTEFAWQGKTVPANDSIDWFGEVRLNSADFLVGGASANTALTWEAEGEVGLS